MYQLAWSFPSLYENLADHFLTAQQKYYFEAMASNTPIIGGYFRARDAVKYMNDYLVNRGLTYEDILYPSMTTGFSGVAGGSSAMVNYVSSNIERLYK